MGEYMLGLGAFLRIYVCVCVCWQVSFGGLGQRRGKVSKITKSVWQLTISGFWLKFVDMTSPWVSPKRTPGILGCLPVPQTEQPVSWQNQVVQAPSPQCLPYLPAETPVIRVWAACRKKNTYREQCHGHSQLCSHFAHGCNQLLL